MTSPQPESKLKGLLYAGSGVELLPGWSYRKGETKITALNKCCGSYWKIPSSIKCHFTEQCLAYVFFWKTLLPLQLPQKLTVAGLLSVAAGWGIRRGGVEAREGCAPQTTAEEWGSLPSTEHS